MQPNATELKVSDDDSDSQLTPRQALALPYITAAPSAVEGAIAANIGRTTLHRWMNDPTFRAEFELQRKAVADLAYSEFRGLALKSVLIFAELLDDPNPHVRLQAARATVRTALKVEESQDIRKRLEVLGESLGLLKDQV